MGKKIMDKLNECIEYILDSISDDPIDDIINSSNLDDSIYLEQINNREKLILTILLNEDMNVERKIRGINEIYSHKIKYILKRETENGS